MFTAEPEAPKVQNENPLLSWYKKFASQPHQPFFGNGLIFLVLFLGVLLLNYTGFIELKASLLTYHAYALIFVVFVQFFLGFLFVVFPRFLMQAEILPEVYMKQFAFYFLGSLLFLIGLFISNIVTLVASLILFAIQIVSFKTLYDIHMSSKMADKNDTKWVLISFLSGLIAHGVFLLSLVILPVNFFIQKIAINAGFYLFLFALIFAISQRMIPFFTSVKVPGYAINKSKQLMPWLYSLLILKVALLTYGEVALNFLADIPLFVLFVREFIKWKLPVFKVVPIMWVLYVSVLWIPIGFFISSIESIAALSGLGIVFEKSVLHIFAVGYFITILLGFGTRVVLGHSGRTPTADGLTTWIFLLAQVVVLLRFFAAMSINLNFDYLFWINISTVCLIALLLIWSIKYLPILLKGK